MLKKVIFSGLFLFFIFFAVQVTATSDGVVIDLDPDGYMDFGNCRLTYNAKYSGNITGMSVEEELYIDGKNLDNLRLSFILGQTTKLEVRGVVLSPKSDESLFSIFLNITDSGNTYTRICSTDMSHSLVIVKIKIFATLDKNGVSAKNTDSALKKYTSFLRNPKKVTGRVIDIYTKRNPYSFVPHEIRILVLIDN